MLTARLLTDAERIAHSITVESSKAKALSDIARALAVTDPDRAARLLTDAEGIVIRSGINEYERALAMRDFAKPLATVDPDRAERIA